MRSFETVTGPKVEKWLVKTIGALLAVVGASLVAGGIDKRFSKAIPLLAIGTATTLGATDVINVKRGRISPIYLTDAVVELGFLLAWLLESRTYTRGHGGQRFLIH